MLSNALWAGTPVSEADKELRAYQTQPAVQHFDLLIACLLTVGVIHGEVLDQSQMELQRLTLRFDLPVLRSLAFTQFYFAIMPSGKPLKLLQGSFRFRGVVCLQTSCGFVFVRLCQVRTDGRPKAGSPAVTRSKNKKNQPSL